MGRLVLVVALVLATPRLLSAQGTCPQWPCGDGDGWQTPRDVSDAAEYAIIAGTNLTLAGVTAAVAEYRRGGSFWRGLTRGAAGGAVALAGRQIAGARFTGAGVLGRGVGVMGGSMVNNALRGLPALARVMLPVGPLRLYVEPGAADRVRAKLDLAGVFAIGYALVGAGSREVDWGATLSSGVPVLVPGAAWEHAGGHLAGVVLMGPWRDPAAGRRAMAHERVHAGQYDFIFLTWGEPAERSIVRTYPRLRGLYRYVDFGLSAGAWGVLNVIIPDGAKPWEHEAYLLSGTKQ